MKLTFPTIDVMAARIHQLGANALMFKVDLSRFFRQIPLDPGEYSLMGFVWNNEFWFDIVSPMGLRSAPHFAQRISNALKFIHNNMGYFIFNYIDDFLGAEDKDKIWNSFRAFKRLLKNLNIDQSIDKEIEPTSMINCIGTLVSAQDQTLQVLPERMHALWVELNSWLNKNTATVREVQVLVGKLQFVCSCVRPGRLFMSRLLRLLKNAPQMIEIDEEFRKDILWWIKFMPEYNGVSMMWAIGLHEVGKKFSTDACLKGLGAVFNNEYITAQFSEYEMDPSYSIVHLELLAIVVAVKVWSESLAGYINR